MTYSEYTGAESPITPTEPYSKAHIYIKLVPKGFKWHYYNIICSLALISTEEISEENTSNGKKTGETWGWATEDQSLVQDPLNLYKPIKKG